MRIQIIQRPTLPSIDGIRLDRFEPGRVYEVGTSLGSLLLAEGWAAPPVSADAPRPIPLRHMNPADLPPNLIIERSSTVPTPLAIAPDRSTRRRRGHS